jgi:putative ATP-dependent endonuclease of the OLD family
VLTAKWSEVHRGEYYADPSVSFARNEVESLLRHLSVGFAPGHGESRVDFSRLSDGQQSLLYLSLVLAVQDIGRKVLNGELGAAFDMDKLRPAVFTMIAVEEPENSLSPHYLGRVARALAEFSENDDAQAVVATHSPSLLRRALPECVRYLRLGDQRKTIVKRIELPTDESAYKFVREGVQAFPELYFSRLVVLGEGDSEEIVLPRLLQARDVLADDASISVVPLSGRHVNHFWRLLNGLGIPHVTLLDLDLARYQGGWGRIKYAARQLLKYADVIADELTKDQVDEIPAWDDQQGILIDDDGWISKLEEFGVFFSSPLDLDFMMMQAYPKGYGVKDEDLQKPDETTLIAVLGKNHDAESQYSDEERSYFSAYYAKFKLGSKPTWHLSALAKMDDEDLLRDLPDVLLRMFDRIETELDNLPE